MKSKYNNQTKSVWDLEQRRLASNLQWESNISAFSVAFGTNYIVLIAYQNGVIILWDVNEDKVVLVRSPKDMQIKDEIIIPSASDIRRESLNTNSDDEQAEKEISALC
ncbi:Synaptobrevin [Artemisia annua]|uniref:Synaptobrevin n=1 Tax=Artemisia annua TaxID=35608 RepID=A0A2U1M7Y6_ARTAN|nr:Synaptobrevin [Artemisia annua]